MSVSPVQRTAAVVLIVMLIFWFYRKQTHEFRSRNFPLVSGAETVFMSENPQSDKFFCEKVLGLEVLDVRLNTIIFSGGIVLEGGRPDPADTLVLRTRRMKDLWYNIIASEAAVIYPPQAMEDAVTAAFMLPGGAPVKLAVRE